MGFLDKAGDRGARPTKAAQEKLDDVQAERAVPTSCLRDLGAWYYAERTGGIGRRPTPTSSGSSASWPTTRPSTVR